MTHASGVSVNFFMRMRASCGGWRVGVLREGVECVPVPINPVEHGRRRQSQLANHVLTESIFSWTDQPEKKLFCQDENAQALAPPKAAYQFAAGANTLAPPKAAYQFAAGAITLRGRAHAPP